MKNQPRRTAENRLSRIQELLLKTALMSGEQSLAAGLEWLETVNLEDVGRAENRLFPLAYDRLRSAGVEHRLMPLLKGLKRHSWYCNQLLFREAGFAIDALQSAGLEVMLIKGAALAHAYYGDYSSRSMNDLDLLVRPEDMTEAVSVLSSHGWYSEGEHAPLALELRYHHARHFYNPKRKNIDLHWHLMTMCVEPYADVAFWEKAQETTFQNRSVYVLDAADQLLHVCAHGALGADTAPLQWVADAMTVIRKVPDLNWERLLQQARERELIVLVREALNYLNRTFDAPIPEEVLHDLNSWPVKVRDEREYAGFINPPSTILQSLESTLRRYDRISRRRGVTSHPSSFTDFLCANWGASQKSKIPLVACRKLRGKLLQSLQAN